MPAKILIVVTSHVGMGDTGHPTGVWIEELSTPYYVFRDAGADVTIASIAGGPVPFDPSSMPVNADGGEGPEGVPEIAASVRRFLDDEEALDAVRNTLAINDVDGAGFDAIFLPGGHGTMWDLPKSETLARMIGAAFDEGRPVSAVCHGPAGLVSARRADGRPIVEGRRVTAFTNSEEDAVGLTRVVPFLLEDRLKELGGIWECAGNWQPCAVRDGNLITGQNPQSSEAVARYVLAAMGAFVD